MKLAILLTGMYRELPTSIKTWKFIDEIECDFYVSTWDKSTQKNDRLGYDLNEPITEELIKSYLPNSVVNVLNQNDYDFSADSNGYHNSKQIFHWKNALRLMSESGVSYDSIMIIRSDAYINYSDHSSFLFELNKTDRVYGLSPIWISGPNQRFLEDYFFVGKLDVMKKMITNLPSNIEGNIHHGLALYFLSIGIISETVQNFSHQLVRPNTRNIENLNSQIVSDKFFEWGINTGVKI